MPVEVKKHKKDTFGKLFFNEYMTKEEEEKLDEEKKKRLNKILDGEDVDAEDYELRDPVREGPDMEKIYA